MVLFSLEVWLGMGLIAGVAVLAILGVAASARREECRKHDLKARVHELREAYQKRLAELRRGGGDDDVVECVEVVDDQAGPNSMGMLREAA